MQLIQNRLEELEVGTVLTVVAPEALEVLPMEEWARMALQGTMVLVMEVAQAVLKLQGPVEQAEPEALPVAVAVEVEVGQAQVAMAAQAPKAR